MYRVSTLQCVGMWCVCDGGIGTGDGRVYVCVFDPWIGSVDWSVCICLFHV